MSGMLEHLLITITKEGYSDQQAKYSCKVRLVRFEGKYKIASFATEGKRKFHIEGITYKTRTDKQDIKNKNIESGDVAWNYLPNDTKTSFSRKKLDFL